MARHFDKAFLIGCVVLLGAVVLSAGTEEPVPASSIQRARRIRLEAERAHPELQRAPRRERWDPWGPVRADFRVGAWSTSYDTWLIPNVKPTPPPPPVKPMYPKLFEPSVQADMDGVTVRAVTRLMPGVLESRTAPFESVVLERREGIEWRVIRSFDPNRSSFEHVDTSVAPRREYAYRWVGVPSRPSEGKLVYEKVTTLEMPVVTPDIWKIRVRFIYPDPQTKVLTASLDLQKYEQGRWHRKSECKVPMEPGYRIGGTRIEDPVSRWEFVEKNINFDTGLELRSIDEAKQQIVVIDSEKRERVIGR